MTFLGEVSNLTKRQRAVLLLWYREEDLNEGMIYESLWPSIKRPRSITNALVRMSIAHFGEWIDDYGYEMILTDHGRTVMANLLAEESS